VTNLLLRLIVSAGAVLLAQAVFPQLVQVGRLEDALIFAIVLGIFNALVRPVLLLLTCPINLLTLGLFVFVVNAAVFWLATWVWPGRLRLRRRARRLADRHGVQRARQPLPRMIPARERSPSSTRRVPSGPARSLE
jgi:putative membrane protein